MIRNNVMDEDVDLNDRWTKLLEDFSKGEFDYSFFKLLAAHTFSYLYPYHSARIFPREMISILLKIKEFALCFPIGALESAAQLVAYEFVDQIENGWKQINRNFDRNRFVICADDGKRYIIDANTFDLYQLF